MRLSIIIPMLNEAEYLAATIRSAQETRDAELIVVDGGSQDGSVELARSMKAMVMVSSKGRARQMNAGAKQASGNALLFLHADTRLPSGFQNHIEQILAKTAVAAGAFQLRIEGHQGGLRFIEKMANWRSRRFQMPYGDQALFMTKETFQKIGGFPDMPIMEDFEIIRRLQRLGRIGIASVPVVTSCRRWQERGVWTTTLINQVAIVSYLAGISTERISRWRRGRPEIKSAHFKTTEHSNHVGVKR